VILSRLLLKIVAVGDPIIGDSIVSMNVVVITAPVPDTAPPNHVPNPRLGIHDCP
jgi:hypothetical protein